jgi:hypothetical protein
MAKMVGILFLAAVVISFLPLLGRWHSLHTAVLGSLALAFVLAMIEKANPGIATGRVALWPGFWFFLGLVVVGSVMAWLGILLAALLSTAFEIAVEPLEGVGQLLMIPVGAVFGFIPVFMYGAYLGAQLRAGG